MEPEYIIADSIASLISIDRVDEYWKKVKDAEDAIFTHPDYLVVKQYIDNAPDLIRSRLESVLEDFRSDLSYKESEDIEYPNINRKYLQDELNKIKNLESYSIHELVEMFKSKV